jgi:Ca2+-binding RTX toxin-like protein
MASIPGSHYDVYSSDGRTVNFSEMPDQNNASNGSLLLGDYNLEVVVNSTGTGNYTTAPFFQGLLIESTDGHTITLLHGDYAVIDGRGGENNTLIAGDGNVTIVGAESDRIEGGTAGNQVLDSSRGNQWVLGGSGGNETIFGGTGDTVTGGSGGDEFINGWAGGQSITGGSGGNETIFGSASGRPADTIHGGSGGNETIAGGAGDTITGGSDGNEFIDGTTGGMSIHGGTGGNETIRSGAGDSITGGSGGNETIVGVFGNTITGGAANTFIDAQSGGESVSGGSGNTSVWGGTGDTIQGASGTGSATIAFSPGHTNETIWDDGATSTGNDTVYDFSQGSGDRVSLSSSDTASTVVANSTEVGGNVVIHLSDGSNITLVGVSKAQLDTGYFSSH